MKANYGLRSFWMISYVIFLMMATLNVKASLPLSRPEGYFDLENQVQVDGKTIHLIQSKEQLLALNDQHYRDIILIKNTIDLEGEEVNLFESFEGIFDGLGNTLKNINNSHLSLIANQNKGVIQNLRFSNVQIQFDDRSLGLLVTENFGNINNVIIEEARLSSSPLVAASNYFVGIIASINHPSGNIKNITVEVDVSSSNALRLNFGGIVALNEGTIENTISNGTVLFRGANRTLAGGIVADNRGTLIGNIGLMNIDATTTRISSDVRIGKINAQNDVFDENYSFAFVDLILDNVNLNVFESTNNNSISSWSAMSSNLINRLVAERWQLRTDLSLLLTLPQNPFEGSGRTVIDLVSLDGTTFRIPYWIPPFIEIQTQEGRFVDGITLTQPIEVQTNFKRVLINNTEVDFNQPIGFFGLNEITFISHDDQIEDIIYKFSILPTTNFENNGTYLSGFVLEISQGQTLVNDVLYDSQPLNDTGFYDISVVIEDENYVQKYRIEIVDEIMGYENQGTYYEMVSPRFNYDDVFVNNELFVSGTRFNRVGKYEVSIPSINLEEVFYIEPLVNFATDKQVVISFSEIIIIDGLIENVMVNGEILDENFDFIDVSFSKSSNRVTLSLNIGLYQIEVLGLNDYSVKYEITVLPLWSNLEALTEVEAGFRPNISGGQIKVNGEPYDGLPLDRVGEYTFAFSTLSNGLAEDIIFSEKIIRVIPLVRGFPSDGATFEGAIFPIVWGQGITALFNNEFVDISVLNQAIRMPGLHNVRLFDSENNLMFNRYFFIKRWDNLEPIYYHRPIIEFSGGDNTLIHLDTGAIQSFENQIEVLGVGTFQIKHLNQQGEETWFEFKVLPIRYEFISEDRLAVQSIHEDIVLFHKGRFIDAIDIEQHNILEFNTIGHHSIYILRSKNSLENNDCIINENIFAQCAERLASSNEMFPDLDLIIEDKIDFTVSPIFKTVLPAQTDTPIDIELLNQPLALKLNGRQISSDNLRINYHGKNVIEVIGINDYSETVIIEFVNPISLFIYQYRAYLFVLAFVASATLLFKTIEVIRYEP